jgi:HK97 family phage major capsid protein
MKDTIRELRQKRASIIAQAREALERAKQEKRDNTQEFQEQWDKFMKEADDLQKQIEREERMAALEGELNNHQPPKQDPKQQEGRELAFNETEEYRSAFNKFLLNGYNAVFTPDEQRALQAGVNVDGGYTIAPMQFVRDLIKDIDNAVFIRQLANVMQLTSSTSLGVPTLTQDVEDADWTTELATGNETTMQFGQRELKPNPLAKRIKVSNKLLRASALPIEQIVRQRLAYKFAVTQEKAFLTGDGTGKPLGVFTASANGISTNRDVSQGNTTTSITYDGLISAKYALKEGYLRNAVWIFHRDAIKEIMKLKDNDGRYLIDPNGPNADSLLGRRYYMSEYAPNTFTAGNYVGILGDFSHYWIADSLELQIQRLVELYAETNQTGFIGRLETDGQPVNEKAFVRVKLATA